MPAQTIHGAFVEARDREFAYIAVELIQQMADDSECSVLNNYYSLVVGGRKTRCSTPEEALHFLRGSGHLDAFPEKLTCKDWVEGQLGSNSQLVYSGCDAYGRYTFELPGVRHYTVETMEGFHLIQELAKHEGKPQ